MKKNPLFVILALVLLSAFACRTLEGGFGDPAADSPYEEPAFEEPMTEEPVAEEPVTEEPVAGVGDVIEDVTGTTWTLTYFDNVMQETYTYDITFLPDGVLDNEHPNDTTHDNDSWEQDGSTVILYFNNAYATYTGEIDGNKISGTAVNVTGSTWEWSAILKD